MPATYARPELLASVEWLAENIGRPGIRVVDCRWRPDGSASQVYATGHVPGAVHLDWATELVDRDDPVPVQLAGPKAFAAAVARAGIGDGSTGVLYDDVASLYAARVWWSLRAYGFTSARVLDGGYPRWEAQGLEASNALVTPEPATFTPRADLRIRLTASDVRALLGADDVELVDTRAPAEYRGQGGNARRLGHIPGALNVPVARMTTQGTGLFRSPDEVRRALNGAGLTRGRRIVVYDGSGVGAAKMALVLALLGYDDVAVYDGGWAEWGNRLDLPVER